MMASHETIPLEPHVAPPPESRDQEEAAPNMGKVAVWLAKQGFAIFPLHTPVDGKCSCGDPECGSPGKHPRTKNGVLDATTDVAQVTAWWQRWPNANIGIATGAPSGLLVVDVDPRNGGPAGRDEFIRRVGPVPETLEVETGGGGRHFYFRYGGGPVPKTITEGIDLKGDGGYVVAPPSLHFSGNRYEVDGLKGARAFLSIAPTPQWLLKRIAAPRHNSHHEAATDAKWAPGERNNKLVSEAGSMRRRGLPLETILAALLQINELQCDPPLPEGEVRQIAVSVSRYEPGSTYCVNSVYGVPSAGAEAADANESPQHSGASWPDPLKEEALHGVAGEVVRIVGPHTEADPAALLIQLLVAFGNLVGRGPHFVVEAIRHFVSLFIVIVGRTSKARKGTSVGQVQSLFGHIDPEWCTSRVMGGLSTGEGLIWHVRDEIREFVPIKEKSQIVRHEEQVTDPGVKDKRLLVTEPEFASVLQRADRETNTLSAIIRQAWDSGNLRVLTKKQAATATDAHVSLIGHITKDELKRCLNKTEAANGFANRFLWVCSKRSKCLPDGGSLSHEDLSGVIQRLKNAVAFARSVSRMERDSEARSIWHKVYEPLSDGQPGLFGAVTSRAEAQVLRLSCLYALLDCSAVVRAEHLMAALAVWEYCEASARFIFGDALGDATADEILRALLARPDGMTRDDIREHFGRNRSSGEIDRALGVLQECGRVRMVKEPTKQGRPPERWFAS